MTGLLPELLPNAVYSAPKHDIEPSGRVLLHRTGDVRVEIQRRCYRRMAEALLRDLGVLVGEQQKRCVRVPQIMEANAREVAEAAQEAPELVCEAVGLERLAVLPSTNQGFAGLAHAKRQ